MDVPEDGRYRKSDPTGPPPQTADVVSPHKVRPAKVQDNSGARVHPDLPQPERCTDGGADSNLGVIVTATDVDGDVLKYRLTGTHDAQFDMAPEDGRNHRRR